jgi:hypothetical protein
MQEESVTAGKKEMEILKAFMCVDEKKLKMNLKEDKEQVRGDVQFVSGGIKYDNLGRVIGEKLYLRHKDALRKLFGFSNFDNDSNQSKVNASFDTPPCAKAPSGTSSLRTRLRRTRQGERK